jgi:hypothetical protein
MIGWERYFLSVCYTVVSTVYTTYYNASKTQSNDWYTVEGRLRKVRGGTTWTVDLKCREVKTRFCRKRWMQTGFSETLIGWKSGKTTDALYGAEWREHGIWALHSAYRGCSHRRQSAAWHTVNLIWFGYRSPIPVGRRGGILLVHKKTTCLCGAWRKERGESASCGLAWEVQRRSALYWILRFFVAHFKLKNHIRLQ